MGEDIYGFELRGNIEVNFAIASAVVCTAIKSLHSRKLRRSHWRKRPVRVFYPHVAITLVTTDTTHLCEHSSVVYLPNHKVTSLEKSWPVAQKSENTCRVSYANNDLEK